MRLTQTEADVLLNDAVRMIRVDEYRLATVMLSYASCACALHVRLGTDKGTVELPERLKEMRGNLEMANGELEKVHKRREMAMNHPTRAVLTDNEDDRTDAIDPCAAKLIDQVRGLINLVIDSLKTRNA